MGASASLLSDKIDEQGLMTLCGDMYTPNIFLFLKDRNDTVDRAQFLQIAMNVVEQEVFHLYSLYSPEGDMDEITAKVFFRNAKLLTKKDFPIARAADVFNSVLQSGQKTIRYIVFRFELLPKVADIKEMSLEKLLLRLSRSDEPLKDEVIIESQRIVDTYNRHEEFSPVEELARIKAALALQRAARPRQAKMELAKLRELKEFEADVADYSELALKTHTGPDEIACQEKFKVFLKHDDIRSKNPDMKLRDFVQLCYATNIIPVDVAVVNFTAADARHIFNCATAKFFNKTTGTFAEGVSAGKRISYGVFRNLVIPEIGKISGKTTEEVVSMIASNNVVIPTVISSV